MTMKVHWKFPVLPMLPMQAREDKGNCAVLAIMHVTGVPYADARKFCVDHLCYVATKGKGRQVGTKTGKLSRFAKDRTIVYGYRVFERPVQSKGYYTRHSRDSYGYREAYTRTLYPTLAQLMPTMRHGRFVVTTRDHAFAVIDGVVIEKWKSGARQRVRNIYEFIPSSQIGESEAG